MFSWNFGLNNVNTNNKIKLTFLLYFSKKRLVLSIKEKLTVQKDTLKNRIVYDGII